MNRVSRQHGFTLIELMLAMGFVSLLLIAIAMTVIQIGNIYNRGITLKDVNQAGRSLASELQRSINQTAPFSVVVDHTIDPNSRYVQQDWGGRLCLGQYSYIWNYGVALDPTKLNPNRNIYLGSSNEIRFVKVFDPNTSYCTKASTGKEYKDVIFSDAVELLNVGQHNLAIHSFAISAPATAGDNKTGQQLYSIEFMIGTNNQTALTYNTGEVTCLPPGDKEADPSYCSINQFNIVVRAGNTIE